MKKTIISGALIVGLLTTPLAAKQTCQERLEAAKTLTGHPTWVAMQLDQLENGVTMSHEALKQKWLDGKKRGYTQIKEIISDCERQAKQTDNPVEAARLLAVVFNARLAEHGTANHPDIYADAIATISSVDHHDETDAVVPFLVTAGMNMWRDYPEESKHLMQRAIDLAERHYGKTSPKRADILANFAFLYSPVRVSPGYERPHTDAKRAEALYSEALAIYDAHPEAMATEEYSGLVGQAKNFYRLIGNEDRANVLGARYLELFNAAAAARKNNKN